MTASRYFSNVAVATTLTAGINDTATTVPVADTTGYPTSFPFVIVVDYQQANAEIMEVSAVAGPNLTVSRGVDGTAKVAHSLGASVVHAISGRDEREGNEHRGSATGVHGVASAVVGATDNQTLQNKTIDGSENIIFNIPESSVVGLVADLADAAVNVTDEATRALAAEALLIPLTQMGVASGVATLDANTQIPVAQLPYYRFSTTTSLTPTISNGSPGTIATCAPTVVAGGIYEIIATCKGFTVDGGTEGTLQWSIDEQGTNGTFVTAPLSTSSDRGSFVTGGVHLTYWWTQGGTTTPTFRLRGTWQTGGGNYTPSGNSQIFVKRIG